MCSPAVVIAGRAMRICCALCGTPWTALTEISPPVAPSEKDSSFVMLRLAPVLRHAQATGSAEGVGSWRERQTVLKKTFSDVGALPGHG
eukprot:466463-Rhodomonas_salina.1